MLDNDRPRLVGLADPAEWTSADLREFDEGRAAYLAAVGERCGVPWMNAFVHALDLIDGLDVHLAMRAVTASELCRRMIVWTTERSECTFRGPHSQRSAPPTLYHHGIACDRAAPRRARIWLVEIMNGRVQATNPDCAGIVTDAALCMNELVIAALTAGSAALALSVAIAADVFRVSVLGVAGRLGDKSDPNMPALRAQVMSFRIVNGLADDWGADSVALGCELWAEFALQPSQKCARMDDELAGAAP